MNNGNVIPRKFTRIYAKTWHAGQGIEYGDDVEIYRDEVRNHLVMLHPKTGNTFYTFGSHLRNKDLFEFVKVVVA
jgi:hypothetical protein